MSPYVYVAEWLSFDEYLSLLWILFCSKRDATKVAESEDTWFSLLFLIKLIICASFKSLTGCLDVRKVNLLMSLDICMIYFLLITWCLMPQLFMLFYDQVWEKNLIPVWFLMQIRKFLILFQLNLSDNWVKNMFIWVFIRLRHSFKRIFHQNVWVYL